MRDNINCNDKKAFIIKYGIKRFGIPSSIIMILLLEILNSHANVYEIDLQRLLSWTSLSIVILFLCGGYVWGYIMWFIFIKKNKKTK